MKPVLGRGFIWGGGVCVCVSGAEGWTERMGRGMAGGELIDELIDR